MQTILTRSEKPKKTGTQDAEEEIEEDEPGESKEDLPEEEDEDEEEEPLAE